MVLCKDFSTEKRRNNTREKIFFHVCLASPISAVRATRSGFFFFFHFFTLLFFIFLHITRYSSDPRIANANRGGSNLFIYSFMPRDLIWDGVVRKRDSLDHIHPKPANLGEQLPITGIKDLLTDANRLLDPTEELWSFGCYYSGNSAIIAVVYIGKYVSEYLITGKVSIDVPQFLLFI